LVTACTNPEDLVNGDLTIAGPPAPGARIRICDPDSRTPIPKGERGEIHQTGPGLVKAYLGIGVGEDQFYIGDDGRTWFVTGDQGVMLPDGRISITGRYKDMINRGGENIAPASIATILSRFCGVQVWLKFDSKSRSLLRVKLNRSRHKLLVLLIRLLARCLSQFFVVLETAASKPFSKLFYNIWEQRTFQMR